MARTIEVKIGGLSDALNAILDEYGDEAITAIETAAKKAGQKAAKTLKSTSPKDTGDYAKGWATKTQTERTHTSTVVYNRIKPGLTHLLEHGHANRTGGRTPAHVHIAPVNEEAQKQFLELVEEALKE